MIKAQLPYVAPSTAQNGSACSLLAAPENTKARTMLVPNMVNMIILHYSHCSDIGQMLCYMRLYNNWAVISKNIKSLFYNCFISSYKTTS